MIHAREQPDGRLTDITQRPATHADDVPLDEVPEGFGPFRRDPQNPRRAIPHAALLLIAARAARRARAVAAETRMVILARIRTRLANAGKATAGVDAQIAEADVEVVDALRDET